MGQHPYLLLLSIGITTVCFFVKIDVHTVKAPIMSFILACVAITLLRVASLTSKVLLSIGNIIAGRVVFQSTGKVSATVGPYRK